MGYSLQNTSPKSYQLDREFKKQASAGNLRLADTKRKALLDFLAKLFQKSE